MRWTALAVLVGILGCAGRTRSGPEIPPMSTDYPVIDADVDKTCRKLLLESKEWRAAVLAARSPRTVENTLVPYQELWLRLDEAASLAWIASESHPDAKVRERAEATVQDLEKYRSELGLDRALYDAVAAIDTGALQPLEQRLVLRILRDFRRSGVDKDETTRRRIQELNEKIGRAGQEFTRNLREDVRSIDLDSEKELEGLPEDYIASHRPNEKGKIVITTEYPDCNPFLRYAVSGEARKRLFIVNQQRGFPKNVDVLDGLLARRHELARLLGYKTWADYVTEDKMIRTAAAAEKFIREIADGSKARSDRELAELLEIKRREDPAAQEVFAWEGAYYGNKLRETKYAFDAKAVRPYFEFAKVKKGLMELMQRLFAVRFEAIERPNVWHESVDGYRVLSEDDGTLLGHAFFDLHPREGKYKHACHCGLRSGIAGRQLPAGLLLCNFPDPKKNGGRALMDAGDVRTFFHEFGHLMHHILGGRQKWLAFSGVSTEWDFAEAPSQLLEEWLKDPAVLRLFAHHVDTGEPIPDSLVEQMCAADEFGKGLMCRQQMAAAMLSLRLHWGDPGAITTADALRETMKEFSPYRYVEKTYFHLSFGHLEGYSAIYYTYAWSLVIAKDLLSVFRTRGMLNREATMAYRRKVLEPGGSRDAADLVQDFLGRPYSSDAFRKWLEE